MIFLFLYITSYHLCTIPPHYIYLCCYISWTADQLISVFLSQYLFHYVPPYKTSCCVGYLSQRGNYKEEVNMVLLHHAQSGPQIANNFPPTHHNFPSQRCVPHHPRITQVLNMVFLVGKYLPFPLPMIHTFQWLTEASSFPAILFFSVFQNSLKAIL